MTKYEELFNRQNKAWAELRAVALPRVSLSIQSLWLEILNLPHREYGLGSIFLTEQKCWVRIEDQKLEIDPNEGYHQEVPYQVIEKGLTGLLNLIRLNREALS